MYGFIHTCIHIITFDIGLCSNLIFRMILNLKMYNNRMILAKLLFLHRLCQCQILMNQVYITNPYTKTNTTSPKTETAADSNRWTHTANGATFKFLRFDDEFDAYGKYIAHKLRSLTGMQAVFARKLINDVIFQGEIEELDKDFKVTNLKHHSLEITSRDYALNKITLTIISPMTLKYTTLNNRTVYHPITWTGCF